MRCAFAIIGEKGTDGKTPLLCERCNRTISVHRIPDGNPSRVHRKCIKPGPAPGTELTKLIRSLGMKPDKCGGACAELARKMDAGGAQWCRDNREEILAQLNAAYSKLSLLDRAAIATKAVEAGVALPMLWKGAAEWLIDEAIRRAEASAAQSSSAPPQ